MIASLKPFNPSTQKNIYVLKSTISEIIHHGKPKFCAFIFAYPYAKNIFVTVELNAQNDIGCLSNILMILLYLVMNGIHEDKRIYIFQRTVLPRRKFRGDFFYNFTDQPVRYLNVIEIFYLIGNISLAHTAGVEREDILLHQHFYCIYQ